ncbi:MAG TPA: serine/threonine-protein kinase [Planctomycetota bacterium]|nr:serine/threonine-protein kinase [Planctomycetota bacterium]
MHPHPDPNLLDLVERGILAFERDGDAGFEQALAGAGELAPAAREHIAVLRASGLLQAPEMPERIGGWRVLKRLGSGGMGTVYLGEQSEPIARRAAIKVIRRGMDSHEVLARFAIERRALALLDHQSIARILDAGSTEDGRPYLVMDYVAGLPILRYCDERQLDTSQRLRLFVQVCDAVQHAHHKGLLHRDLKPSNILVADREARPLPVVIDFGVAKSVGGTAALAAQLTLPGRLIGTPEYMSPEQATNESDVDTRTDVYSLGVILYEMLTSTLPFDPRALRLQDIARVLRNTEPPTPSTRITSLGDAAAIVAAQRRTSIGSLRRALRGDLDWIVMKALDRDRNRRYGMPGELAADIERHLRSEPITAGAPGAWHRLSKFCARNRLQVVAATLVLGTLCAGLVSSLAFYRDAAASSLASAESLDTALQAVGELVQVGDSDLVTVPHLEGVRADLLRRSVEFYRRFLARNTATDPRLLPGTLEALVRLGNMQRQLGQYDEAMQHTLEVETLLATPAAATLPTAVRREVEVDALVCRAHVLDRTAKPEAALTALQKATPIARELLKPGDQRAEARLADMLAFTANLQADRDPAAAMACIDEAEAIADRAQEQHPDELPTLANAMGIGADRANLLMRTGRRDECLAAVEAVRKLRRTMPQREAWALAQPMLDIVDILHGSEQPDEAIAVIDDTLPFVEKQVADHPSVVAYRSALIRLQNARGDAELLRRNFATGLEALRTVIAQCEAALALTPNDLVLQQQLVIGCTNIAVLHNQWRNFGGDGGTAEVEAALRRATAVLDAMPAGEPRRKARLQRLEVHGLWGLWRQAQGDRKGAITDTTVAVALAEELAAEAPQTVAYRTRLTEMLRRLAGLLLDDGRAGEALGRIDRALAMNKDLQNGTEAQRRWQERRRELLLLQMRARGATGDLDGAFAALDEQLALGDELDWIGRQNAARALVELLASLPEADPGRSRVLARGRELIEGGLAFAEKHRDNGTGHGTIAVMTGNTLVLARELEAAGHALPAAAQRAEQVVQAFAEVWQAAPGPRNENRVRDHAAAWLQLAARAGDATAAFDQIERLFAGNTQVLAHLAGVGAAISGQSSAPDVAAQVRARSIALLRAALAAGLAPARLGDEQFAPLRADAAFDALAPAGAQVPPDKQ